MDSGAEVLGTITRERREGGIDLGDDARVENPDLQSHGARRRFQVPLIGRGKPI